MSAPPLSVVVASVNGMPYLEDCVAALAEHAPDAEILVADATDEETRQRVRERWPDVRLISFDEPKTVPELRAAGIFEATAPYVALIEDHCLVHREWATALLEAHREGKPVVGGAIRNVVTDRLRDWAAFFCEYSAHMEPVEPGDVAELPGMNVSYDRRALSAIDELLREGRWETWLHAHLRRQGFRLWADPRATIDHAKDFDLGEFLSQRYHYSRSYAGMRNPDLGRKRILYALASPALVPVIYARIVRNVVRRRRHRRELIGATPLILLYTIVWSAGEAVGYAFGGGRSLLKVR